MNDIPNVPNVPDVPVPDGYISVACTIKHETPRALLITLGYEVEPEDSENPTDTVWIPTSQIHSIHRDDRDDTATIYISKWIADKKGL